MKKIILIFLSLVIIIFVGFNIFISSSKKSFTDKILKSNISKDKILSCDFNTFEKVIDGSDPNLRKIGNQWFMFFTKQDFSAKPATTNIHAASLPPNASLSAPVSQWSVSSLPLVQFTPGSWDDEVIETGNYVYGFTNSRISDGKPGYEARIYYVGNNQRFIKGVEIGFLFYNENSRRWEKYPNVVLSGNLWWEKLTINKAERPFAGEPAVVYKNNLWHMFYQACTDLGKENGQKEDSGCFIGHRTSSDGVVWSEPLMNNKKPWISEVFVGLENKENTFFGKPEIIEKNGKMHWVGTDDTIAVRYGYTEDINKDLAHREILFTIDDCKDSNSKACNWKLSGGPTFGFEDDNSIWVYFSQATCSGGITKTLEQCKSKTAWNIARVHCK